MAPLAWKTGELYRCLNPECECEILITQLPQPGRPLESLPHCCSCGTPMREVSQLSDAS